jgi:23S rRNA (guanosine2251-2'-O)-methyltransferase
MKKLSHDEISEKRYTLDNLHSSPKMPVYVLLNSIRSNYNVGSIFRTSDGAMIAKLYLCGYTPHPPLPGEEGRGTGKKEVLKTALGSTESVEWEYVKDPVKIILELKKQGVKICALEMTSKSRLYHNVSPGDFPLCLIVGNEITGVAQELIDLCDFSIEIPQYGIKQSLNAAVAYGIAVFELRRIFDDTRKAKGIK